MKDESGSIGTALSSLGASRGASIQDIVSATTIKAQPSKFAITSRADFKQKIPCISVVRSSENSETNQAFMLKRMVSNILDQSPQLRKRRESVEKISEEKVQLVEDSKLKSSKAISALGEQLWELSKFLVLLYLLTVVMSLQEALREERQLVYFELLHLWNLLGFKCCLFGFLVFLTKQLLLNRNVAMLRWKQKSLGEESASESYAFKILFKFTRLVATLTCRRSLTLQLQLSENCGSQSQEAMEMALNDFRQDFLDQASSTQYRARSNFNSAVITISKPSPFSDQLQFGSVRVLASNQDEDRFKTIPADLTSNNSRSNKQSSGTISSRAKAQEENIKSYFGLSQRNGQTQLLMQKNSGEHSPSARSNNGSVSPHRFRTANSHQSNEVPQDINIESLSNMTSFELRHTPSNNLQVPNTSTKSRFFDYKMGASAFSMAPGQQANHGSGNQDNFEVISKMAVSGIQYQKQSTGGGTHLQSHNPAHRLQAVSPTRQHCYDDRISEKNEDSHSQRHSITQDSEPDSFLPQANNEGSPHDYVGSRKYSIHLNDNLLVNPFSKPSQTEQISLQPSFSMISSSGRSPMPKNFKRMQLREIQKFHSQDHTEQQLQALSRLTNKTESRRDSTNHASRHGLPFLTNKESISSNDIQQQINRRFQKQNSQQTLEDNTLMTAKSQAELRMANSQIPIQSNEFSMNELQNHHQQFQLQNSGALESFRSSKISCSSPTFTHNNAFIAEDTTTFKLQQDAAAFKTQASLHAPGSAPGSVGTQRRNQSNVMPNSNFLLRSETSNELRLPNEQEAIEREKAYERERRQREAEQIERIQFTLNSFGTLFMLLFVALLVQVREDYLRANVLFQMLVYCGTSCYARKIIKSQLVTAATLILMFCSMQYPDSKAVSKYQFYSQVIMSSLFLVYFAVLEGRVCHFASIQKKNMEGSSSSEEEEEGTHLIKQEKIEQIIRSDGHLKNLVQLIPYGIAVLNLEDVSHFNQPFAKVLGVRKQKQVLEALNKFQRKTKHDDHGGQHYRRASNQQHQNHLSFDRTNQSQKSKRKEQQQVKISNLKEDLEYILKNKDLVFAKTSNIFDIYYLEKEQEGFSKQNTSRSPRPKSLLNSVPARDSHEQSSQARKVYSISISPIGWGDKECLLLTVKDITHEKIIDQKQLMDRLKNMIFKSFTHELKTPLNGIIMTVETANFIAKTIISKLRKENNNNRLREKNIEDVANQSKQLHKQLKNMESCSYVLKNIMHDFFDLNQLQTNELTLNVKEFDLAQCIKEIKRIVKYQMKFPDKVQFQHKLEFQNAGGFLGAEQLFEQRTVKMVCDRDRLMQVLLNLLMNSIKFTTKGFIQLQVFVKQHSNPPCIKFKVKDSGIGIEEERQRYIFNLFEQNENSNLNSILKSKNKSARMGLPISQNLCQMMGGVITVKSRVGQGSTFRFVLPLNASECMVTSRAGVDDSLRHRSMNERQFETHQKAQEFTSLLEFALNKEASPEADLGSNDLRLKLKHSNFSHLSRSGSHLHHPQGQLPPVRLASAPRRAKDQDEITDQQSQDEASNQQRMNTLGAGSGGAGPQGSIYGGSGNLDGNQHIQPRAKKSTNTIDEDDDEMDQDVDEGLDSEDGEEEEEDDDFDDNDKLSGFSSSDSEREGMRLHCRKGKSKGSSRNLIFQQNKKIGMFEFFFNSNSQNNKTHILHKTSTVLLDEESKQTPKLQHSHSFIESQTPWANNSSHSDQSPSHPLRTNNQTLTNVTKPLLKVGSKIHQGMNSLNNTNSEATGQDYNSINRDDLRFNPQPPSSELTIANMVAGQKLSVPKNPTNSVTSSIPSFVLEPKNQKDAERGKSHEFILTSRSSFDTENMEEEQIDPRLKLKSPHSKLARDSKHTVEGALSHSYSANDVDHEESKTPKESLAQSALRQSVKGMRMESEDQPTALKPQSSFYIKYREANFSFQKDDLEQFMKNSSIPKSAPHLQDVDQAIMLTSNKDYSSNLLQIGSLTQQDKGSFSSINNDSRTGSPQPFSKLVQRIAAQGANEEYFKDSNHLSVESHLILSKQSTPIFDRNQMQSSVKEEEEKDQQPPQQLTKEARIARGQKLQHEFSFLVQKKKEGHSNFISGDSFNPAKYQHLKQSTDESQQQNLASVQREPPQESSMMLPRKTANFNSSMAVEESFKANPIEAPAAQLPELIRRASSQREEQLLERVESDEKEEEKHESDLNDDFDEDCIVDSERGFQNHNLREFSTKPAKTQEGTAKNVPHQENQPVNSASKRIEMGGLQRGDSFNTRGSMREFIDLPAQSQSFIRMDFDKGQITNFQHKLAQESLMNIGGNFDDMLQSCADSVAPQSNRFMQESQSNAEECSLQSSYRSQRRGGGGGGTGRIKGKPSKHSSFSAAQEGFSKISKHQSALNPSDSSTNQLAVKVGNALLNPQNFMLFGKVDYFPMESRPGAAPAGGGKFEDIDLPVGRARSSTTTHVNQNDAGRKQSAQKRREQFFKLDSSQSFANPGSLSPLQLDANSGSQNGNLKFGSQDQTMVQARPQQRESKSSINSFLLSPQVQVMDSPNSVVNLGVAPQPSHSQTLKPQSALKIEASALSKGYTQVEESKEAGFQLRPQGELQLGSNLGLHSRQPQQRDSQQEITEVVSLKISKRENSGSQTNKFGVARGQPRPSISNFTNSNTAQEGAGEGTSSKYANQTDCEVDDYSNKNIKAYQANQQRFPSFNEASANSYAAARNSKPLNQQSSFAEGYDYMNNTEGNILLTDMASVKHQNSSNNLGLQGENLSFKQATKMQVQIKSAGALLNQSNRGSQQFYTAANEDQALNPSSYQPEEEKKEHQQPLRYQAASPASIQRGKLAEQEEEEKQQRLEKQKKNDSMYESPKSSEQGLGQLKVRIETQSHQNESFNAQEGGSPHKCPQIMVVDDVQMNRYAIEQMLLLIFGIKVLQAENGQECIDVLQQYYRDKGCSCGGIKLILMDLEMPVMDGITAAVRLRRIMGARDPRGLPEIPIIALTAYLDEKENCLRAGMKGFMVKPSSKIELEEVLKKYRIIS